MTIPNIHILTSEQGQDNNFLQDPTSHARQQARSGQAAISGARQGLTARNSNKSS